MPRLGPEAGKGLPQGLEDRAGIAAQRGAETLGPVEGARGLEEFDAAVDLVHVMPDAERVERQLGRDVLPQQRHGGDGFTAGRDAVADARIAGWAGNRRADRIVRLTGTPTGDRRVHRGVDTRTRGGAKQ